MTTSSRVTTAGYTYAAEPPRGGVCVAGPPGPAHPATRFIAGTLTEVGHHGTQIGALRDLYAWRQIDRARACGHPNEEWGTGMMRGTALDLLTIRNHPANPRNSRTRHGVLKSGITHAFERKRIVAQCVTCGSELHPERAEKYDYCMAPECQEKNLKGLTMVAVGVNKSAEQYLLLDEETRDELARGKYRDQRRGSFGTSMPSSPADGPARTAAPARPAHHARPPPAPASTAPAGAP